MKVSQQGEVLLLIKKASSKGQALRERQEAYWVFIPTHVLSFPHCLLRLVRFKRISTKKKK